MAKSQTEEALLKQLKNPFDPRFVKWRVGATNEKKENGRVVQKATKGIALAYLDAREVMKRLDDVCGVGGWQSKFVEIKDGFICELSMQMPNGDWITKSDSADYTDVEAIKGGASSALKRAAAVWGIGRYLYYLPNVWVPLNERKQMVNIPELPEWALPGQVERWEDVAELELAATQEVDNEDDSPKEDAKAKLREAVNA